MGYVLIDEGIVDEVDYVLINEGRNPLLISGEASKDAARYTVAAKVAELLMRGLLKDNSEIAGHVVEFISDQYGSQFIQQKLETATTEEKKNMVFHEIMPQALSLMTDVFGNYVIQKVNWCLTIFILEDDIHFIISTFYDQVVTLSTYQYGCRVIQLILETIIAETSVTIPGIKYVIDPGWVKVRSYSPNSGIESLTVLTTSKAQALQRSGRAGREGAGKCFCLYPESRFEGHDDSTMPEIKRGNLSNVIL
uniref:RNA helicase n=1 Tax=Lactuca sativa TaxID=4236 RepID=A0A9R1VK57_LACSA|nr:hypothetical protein LSAT_V11C500234340 [Lactuca sativa]